MCIRDRFCTMESYTETNCNSANNTAVTVVVEDRLKTPKVRSNISNRAKKRKITVS